MEHVPSGNMWCVRRTEGGSERLEWGQEVVKITVKDTKNLVGSFKEWKSFKCLSRVRFVL